MFRVVAKAPARVPVQAVRREGEEALPSPKPVMAVPPVDLARITTLADLKAAVGAITGLALKDTAMNLVFGEGALQPPLMVIGEAPGEEEDRTGRPFVGPAGQLLEKMLAAIPYRQSSISSHP